MSSDDSLVDDLTVGDAYASTDVELAVIGTVMVDSNAWGLCTSITPKSFYDPRIGLVWECCQAVAQRGEEVTPATVTEALRVRNKVNTALDATGSLEGVGMSHAVPLVQLPALVRVLTSLATARHVARAAQRIALASRSVPTWEPATLIAYATKEITVASRGGSTTQAVAASTSTEEWMRSFELPLDASHRVARFGVHAVDDALGDGRGLYPQRLYVLAARPSVGKSALAGDATLASAQAIMRSGVAGTVLSFSLEMARSELTERFISNLSGIDANRIARRELSQEDVDRVTQAAGELHRYPILIDDTPGLPFSEIRARAHTEHARVPLSLVVIDHLNIVGRERGIKHDEVAHLSEITGGCKAMAKELNVPVLLLVQLNRQLAGRVDKRPSLTDLRGSGSIEEDADVVLMLYRDELHNPQTQDKGIAEVIITKQRGGRTLPVRTRFIDYLTKFTDVDQAAPQRHAVPSPPSWNEVDDNAEGEQW